MQIEKYQHFIRALTRLLRVKINRGVKNRLMRADAPGDNFPVFHWRQA